MSPYAAAQPYAVLVRIRIEKDGRVSLFRIERPSGLAPMDESVQAIAARVAHIEPPPARMLKNGGYEITMEFKLRD